MNAFIEILNGLAPLVAVLVGTGLFVKYVPFMSKVSNILIPLFNALIAFFTVFAPQAHAGIFSGIGHDLGTFGRALGSVIVAATASHVYEFYLRPVLDKLGVKKA